MYEHILIAIDGSEPAAHALNHGLQLAKALGARVTILNVSEPVGFVGAEFAGAAAAMSDSMSALAEAQRKSAEELLKSAAEEATALGLQAATDFVYDRKAADGILSQAESLEADLIVMGSHGRTPIGRLLFGSETSNVLAGGKVPVLVVR